jgi:hypothetical protein
MDTSNLKKFATEARANLIKGVVDRLRTLGFDENGHVDDADRPERLQGGALFHGELKQGDAFYRKWTALESAITNHPHGPKVGVRQVAEAAAYTWFNRFVAIRILQKNRLIEPQLAYADGGRIPMIVENARSGRLPVLTPDEKMEWERLSEDDSKVLEQFSLLIVAYCHTTPILEKCFGHIDDYTELLLPRNVLADGGFIDLLNTTDYITEEDYKRTELIGWLYQFYISEKKDEVFASFKNKKKAEAEDIPAATQIFTPNWIVKYMVQNTLGRIYLDNNKGSDLAKDWKYLVDTPTASDSIYRYAELKSLKVADFASGSGHILNEFFDMLYSFYEEDAYDSKEAVECIFRKNLIGIDLDTRAKQLSMFSLLLKACQKNRKFVDASVLPRILDMPDVEPNGYTWKEVGGHFCCRFDFEAPERASKELLEAFTLLGNARNLGSTMKFNVGNATREYMQRCLQYRDEHPEAFDGYEADFAPIFESFELILALTDKYSAIAMNPPYMGIGNMNTELSSYVKKAYPNGKTDLFSVFMDVAIDRLAEKAKYGMINMHSWMFLGSFEKLRKDLLDNYCIENMMHLGPRTFDELSGEVVQNTAYVVSKFSEGGEESRTGTYFRLVDGKDCSDKERMFLDANRISPQSLPKSQNIRFDSISQRIFEKMPGSPIGYWVSENFVKTFEKIPLGEKSSSSPGIRTGRDGIFIREWFEISKKDLRLNSKKAADLFDGKWFPVTRGGERRRWYGNVSSVIYGENGFSKVKSLCDDFRLREEEYYFKHGITWTMICSGKPSFRECPEGVLFGNGGPTLYTDSDYYELCALLNTKVAYLYFNLLNPTINYTKSDIEKLPYLLSSDSTISENSKQNISISKADWDAHENSWDFQKNELLAMTLEDEDANVQFDIDEAAKCGKMLCIDRAAPEPESLSWRMRVYQGKWERLFKQLHANEEELNRQFIEIYGLQDELTPDVPLDEVTILQQGEISIGKPADCNMSCDAPLVDYDQIEWHEDVVIKQFVSYAIGCMMGRYRLDKPGLAIAHPNATAEEKTPYQYRGETFVMDDDGIIPLMSRDSAFSDNAVNCFTDFLRVALGAESLTENLNYVEQCLGKTIENYLAKDFWTDHKKMYQNRPIYWLFSSKKGAFKCITYMHRMDSYTAELVRKNYLLKHIDYLAGKIAGLEQDEANLSSGDRKKLAGYRKDYAECIEFDERLQLVASKQIAFDLDDGVVVNYAKFGDVLAKIK